MTPDLVVGIFDSRFQAMERRMDRHEDDMRTQLGKMGDQIGNLDGKVDEMREMLATAAGAKANSSHIGKLALALFAGAAGWFHFDITHLFRSGS